MSKKSKNIILSGVLAVGLLCGSVVCKNNFRKNENITTNNKISLLSYSKTDLVIAFNELKQLEIRTYTDVEWGKNGRIKYFGDWQKANKYGYRDLPNNCKVNYAILILQSEKISYTDKCVITSGEWISPYTNNMIKIYTDIEIDHIVPLKDAWDSGANKWSQEMRIKYANTKNNLLISEGSLNSKKKSKSPDEWMPEINKCGYLIKWTDIKYNYKLTLTKNENIFLKTQLNKC